MAILDLDLGGTQTVIIDSTTATDGDLLAISALGSSTLIVDGVDVGIDSIAGVTLGASPTFAARDGGSLTLDRGLLSADLLSSATLRIEDKSSIRVNAASVDIGSAVTNLLNDFTVEYVGGGDGIFTYEPPALSLLGAVTFNTTGMEGYDVFEVVGATLEPDTTLLGGIDSAYRNGNLYLRSSGLLSQTVNVEIPMTQAEFDLFKAEQGDWLVGGTFTFPTAAAPCFCSGTRILTPAGPRPVEALAAGDLVRTAGGEVLPVLWAGATRLSPRQLDICPDLRPVRISANALGAGYPERDLLVSPQHKILVNGRLTRRVTGAPEAWVAAKHLLPMTGVEATDGRAPVTYHHLLLSRHDVLVSEGLPSESLHLGGYILRRLPRSDRAVLEKMLRDGRSTADRHSLPVIRGGQLRQGVKRHGWDLSQLVQAHGVTDRRLRDRRAIVSL